MGPQLVEKASVKVLSSLQSILSLPLQGIVTNNAQKILTEGNTNTGVMSTLEDTTRIKNHLDKLKKLFTIHKIIQ